MFLKGLLSLVLMFYGSVVMAKGLDDLDMAYPRQPLENLVTGGQPSKEDLEKFAAEGYGLVINLRLPGEFTQFDEGQVVEDLGMKYINIPVKNMRDLTPENAALLHDALESVEGPVVLHCTIGMRASGLLGVEAYLFHDLTKEEAMELGNKAHMGHSDDSIEDAIENIEDRK